MKEILKYVPGFRSNTTWKKGVAVFYYIFTLIAFTMGWYMGLVFLSMPFFIFSVAGLIKYKRKNIPINRILATLIVSFVIMGIGFSYIPESSDDIDAQGNDTAQNEISEIEENQKALEIVQKIEDNEEKRETGEEAENTEDEKRKETERTGDKTEDSLKVHYIDVGQGDCALVHTGNAAMLIDAGNKNDGPSIVSYIKSQGIKKLDYFILTHPHADHIGGAANVVNSIDIDKVLMPKVAHTSKTFEDLLITIRNKGLKITSPTPGDNYTLGSADFKILASNDGSTLNNNSIVNRLVFGNTSFMFTGDAESATESLILQRGYNINSDVLKVGHHGSGTSTTESFLKVVSPKYAVISVGKGNSYGHPDQATLNKLAAGGAEVFRTDESGTVMATSDGNTINFDKKPSQMSRGASLGETKPASTPAPAPTPPITDKAEEVYITNTGSKYHRAGCWHLKSSEIPISLEQAKEMGYEPCGVCKPPK